MRPIGEALQSLLPTSQWIVRGDDIEWLSTDLARPSDEEIEAEQIRLQQVFDSKDYHRKRLEAYPQIGDQLDMLWHAMNEDASKRLEPFYSTIKTIKETFQKQ